MRGVRPGASSRLTFASTSDDGQVPITAIRGVISELPKTPRSGGASARSGATTARGVLARSVRLATIHTQVRSTSRR
jgi:hypothetical protein